MCEQILTCNVNFNLIGQCDFAFRSVLHAAVSNDNTDCIQTLIENNFDVNVVDDLGQTPLMVAAKRGHSSALGKKTCFRIESKYFFCYIFFFSKTCLVILG